MKYINNIHTLTQTRRVDMVMVMRKTGLLDFGVDFKVIEHLAWFKFAFSKCQEVDCDERQ